MFFRPKCILLAVALILTSSLSACHTLKDINPRRVADDFSFHKRIGETIDRRLARSDVAFYDQDGDNRLSPDEFSDAMLENSRYRYRAAEANMNTARYVAADFKAIDTNEDGYLTALEYGAYYDWHISERRRRFVAGEDS